MALSVFLRSAPSLTGGCYMRQLIQGSFRLSPPILQATSSIQVLRPIFIQAALQLPKPTSPLLNSVCSFRTSAVRRDFEREDTSDHSKLWVIEKAISLGLLVLIPISLACPSKPLDIAVAVLAVSHIYWGLEAIIVDYVRVVLFGPLIPKIAKLLLIAVMIVTVGGLYQLIFNDIGIANTIRRFWAIARTKEEQKQG